MDVPPQLGDFVRVRTRLWLVEGTREIGKRLKSFQLAYVDDNAQEETAEVTWSAEIDSWRPTAAGNRLEVSTAWSLKQATGTQALHQGRRRRTVADFLVDIGSYMHEINNWA